MSTPRPPARPAVVTPYTCRSCGSRNVQYQDGVFWCDDCSAFYYLTPAQTRAWARRQSATEGDPHEHA